MACSRFAETIAKFGFRAVALAVLAAFSLVMTEPAQAQSTDTWKSVAIIGGTTAAGAYIGHKVGGSTGALVGAGVGAAAGYAIDRRRRANDYNQYSYGYPGYSGGDDGYYDDGYYRDGGYGPYSGGGYPYPSGFRSSNDYTNSNRCYGRR